MQAIVQDEYGTEPESVLRLAEIAKPTIGDDEVLVHVRAASVDRGTWHVMTGRPYLIRALGFGLRAAEGSESRPQSRRDGRVRRQERDRVCGGR